MPDTSANPEIAAAVAAAKAAMKASPNPTVTSANLASAPLNPRIDAAELDGNIIARSLATPDFINVKSKGNNLAFRWINYKAGDGLRYSQAVAQGWKNATPTDCTIAGEGIPAVYQRDGKIINGDLLLMKHDRATYLGALKNKHEQALHLAGHGGYQQEAARRVGQEIGGVPKHAAGKINVFQPEGTDLSKAVLDRLGSDKE